jgi:ketosteroid isomerase-like protein
MKNWRLLVPLIIVFIQSCSNKPKDELISSWKEEIVQTEKEFSDMAIREGVEQAFLTFAAESAVLKRGNNLVKGRNAIKEHFNGQIVGNVQLEWLPDFVDVSTSGDLGYTYGHYTLTSTDSLGQKIENSGIFHTVWKRQSDGDWRFVWD